MSVHSSERRRLRLAMIGGGPGAMIGDVHRKAARLDDRYELVAGAFSSDPEKSARQGVDLYLGPSRIYGDWRDMLKRESALPPDERPDAVAIVTPNHLHFDQSMAALAAGFHIILDKPMTRTLEEAERLAEAVAKSGKILALTHTYTGYPMVRLARDLVRAGKLGNIRKIMVDYAQGWLYSDFENDPSNRQARWRTDPELSGAGCLGDIGTHAANLSEMVSGLKLVEVAADVSTFVPGRRNDDDASLLAHWEGGVKGVVCASQISVGRENDISIQVYGDKAGLEWRHQECEHLTLYHSDKPKEVLSKGWPYVARLSHSAAEHSRTPSNHPEGIIEAFANIYTDAADAIVKVEAGAPASQFTDFPTAADGLRGMRFIAAALASAKANGAWTRLER